MSRGFTVAHQKVCVHADVRRRALRGWTELTVVPTSLDLRAVVLDARRMRVEHCEINGEAASFEHLDPLSEPHATPNSWDVHYYDMYARKLGPLIRSQPPGELTVHFPESLAVSEAREPAFTSGRETSKGEKACEPIVLRVHFEVHTDGNEGLNCVGGAEPHMYTTHTPIGQATSCWLPCVDGIWSLSTWELEVHVDQYLDPHSVDAELVVVSNNATPVEHPDPQNSQGKIVKFEFFSPVSSQHLGFAVGPFQPVPLVAVDEKSEQAEQAAAAETQAGHLAITAFALPSKATLVAHTCRPLVLAMDYFTHDFGSFPYDSYSLCFVGDFPEMAAETADAAALTVASDALLFAPDQIEPRFADCGHLVRGVAAQWCGVSIVPASYNDFWVTEGIALHLTNLFVRKLMGNNEFRFRIRTANDTLCREDVDRPPIGRPRFRFPLCAQDLAFIRLKAPLVFFILDRRMTKTDRSLGISRVLTKLFLQSMSGDLRSQLSTAHFVRQCEKVAHHRLTKFFDEWVHGSGFPIFRITQRFNKKRLCIEMGIGQVYSRELPRETLRDETVLERAVTHLGVAASGAPGSANGAASSASSKADVETESDEPVYDFPPPSHFTGPMTIRIHEANGTPYEHVVELRDQLTKIDIPYNTKYKRLRRNQKFRRDVSANAANQDGGGDQVINCLGDVLMSEQEIEDWRLVDWGDGGDDDELMFNEAFEWLRADADFEWVGRFFVSQPDYMYASQLQQDQDVVAQYDAVVFFGRQQPHPLYYTVLARTLMDRRYFYGVRVTAAQQLVHEAVPQLGFAGMHLLLRAFRELYCLESHLPRANNFSDVPAYFVQKAIPLALSQVRDPKTGRCPPEIASFLLDLIRYNENSENPYSDGFYLASLLRAATYSQLPDHGASSLAVWDDPESTRCLADVVAEINKSQRLDRWVPSYRHVVTTTSIQMEEMLVEARYGEPRMDKLLVSTQSDESVPVRVASVRSLLNLGGYQHEAVMQYVLELLVKDPLQSVRSGVLAALATLVGHVAINGEYAPRAVSPLTQRQQALARRSVHTVIPLLRSTLGESQPLQHLLWSALRDPRLGSLARRVVLEVCEVLYEASPRMLAVMKCPPLFELSMRRRGGDFTMVTKYRSILRKKKKEPKEAPKLKLKLS